MNNNQNTSNQQFQNMNNNEGMANQQFQNMNNNEGMANQQFQNMNNGQPPKKKNKIIKILAIIGGIWVGIFILVIVIFSIVSATSNKLICKSNEGSITIMYNDDQIVGYTANGITYDMDEQKEYANRVGINVYIFQFSNYFKKNTTGNCIVKKK